MARCLEAAPAPLLTLPFHSLDITPKNLALVQTINADLQAPVSHQAFLSRDASDQRLNGSPCV